MSLYTLEFKLLKPHLRADPRGHCALVCAATGCPPLKDGLYHGDKLDSELDLAARAFLQPGGGYRLESGTLWLSRIFKWYRRDFGGTTGLRRFFLEHAPLEHAMLVRQQRPSIRFMRYDWSLNVSP